MSSPGPSESAAFLLTQIGSHAAARFTDRLREHGLTAPQTGILGLLRSHPGVSQQELARLLGMLPSRIVVFLDELESAGLLQRVRDGVDRRRNSLVLTDAGAAMLRTVASVARDHSAEICSTLTDVERATLTSMLTRIAAQQGLSPDVHPGYRSLRPAKDV